MISKHKDDWNKLKSILDGLGLRQLESKLLAFNSRLEIFLKDLEQIR